MADDGHAIDIEVRNEADSTRVLYTHHPLAKSTKETVSCTSITLPPPLSTRVPAPVSNVRAWHQMSGRLINPKSQPQPGRRRQPQLLGQGRWSRAGPKSTRPRAWPRARCRLSMDSARLFAPSTGSRSGSHTSSLGLKDDCAGVLEEGELLSVNNSGLGMVFNSPWDIRASAWWSAWAR